jgi:hypothetical protein
VYVWVERDLLVHHLVRGCAHDPAPKKVIARSPAIRRHSGRPKLAESLEAKIARLGIAGRAPRLGLERAVMSPRSYDDSEDPLMGRLVEIATGEGRWRPGVIAFCETTLDGPKGAEVSTGRYRVAWGRFESKTHFLEVVAKKNTLKVRIASGSDTTRA